MLGWHNVQPTWCFPFPPEAGIERLERQLKVLRRLVDVVALPEALDDLARRRSRRRPAVALTFDDGYRDNVESLAPMLRRLGLPATFFLVPGLLSREVDHSGETLGWAFFRGTRARLAWEGREYELSGQPQRLEALREVSSLLNRRSCAEKQAAVAELVDLLRPEGTPPGRELFMDWDDARTLVEDGFTIGSHSRRHAVLAREDVGDQQRDLEESRRELEDRLRRHVDLLAYPHGGPDDFDEDTVGAARSAGFRYAFTSMRGINDDTTPSFRLRRYLLPAPALCGTDWVTLTRDLLAGSTN